MFEPTVSLERLLAHCQERHLIDDYSIEGDGVTLTVGEVVHTLTARHASEYVAWLLEQEDVPGIHNPHELLTPPPDTDGSASAASPENG